MYTKVFKIAKRPKDPQTSWATGFTLIEILVVISLSVIVTVSAAGLFFTALISSARKDIVSSVKDEGDYAISQMEFLVRNAIQLVPDPAFPGASTCTTGMSRFSFKSIDNGTTTLFNDNGRIASKSATAATPVYLTSDGVQLTGPTFDCEQASSNFGTYVTITFDLKKNSPDYNRPNPVSDKFYTSVNIRSL